MAKKKSSKKRRQQKSSGGAAATKKRENENDDAFLEEAMQRVAAEKKHIMNHSIIPVMSVEMIFLLSNDILGSVSSFLACKDLFYLSLTCKQMTAAIEEVALQMISASDLRYGGDDSNLSAVGKMHQLLHSPIQFTNLRGKRLGYLRGDKACVYSSNPNRLHTPQYIDDRSSSSWNGWTGETCTAVCSDYVMTSGRHFVKFTVSDTYDENDVFRYFYCRLGLMRPIGLKRTPFPGWCPLYDQLISGLFVLDGSFAEHYRTDAWGEGNVHCCFYSDFNKTCEWSNWNSRKDGIYKDQPWEGMIDAQRTCEYGLLLDLDAGTLSMYQDNRCLGVLMRGLTGEYCWVACLLAQAHGKPHQQNVRIERAPVPSQD